MSLTRRTMLMGTLGLLAGCGPPSAMSRRPGPDWPEVSRPTSDQTPGSTSGSPTAGASGAGSTDESDGVTIIARHRWTGHDPRPSRVNDMGYVSRITVHHEGWKPVDFTGWSDTISRLERIRRSHVQHHGWGDIGYHYIIDRAGRVWEGRDVQYQGAHVKNHNAHNVGVMLLGNFERQYPAQAQLDTLVATLQHLMDRYNVSVNDVHTHRELGSTSCPGRHLQPKMAAYRENGRLA